MCAMNDALDKLTQCVKDWNYSCSYFMAAVRHLRVISSQLSHCMLLESLSTISFSVKEIKSKCCPIFI